MAESERAILIEALRGAEHPAVELRGVEGGALLFLPFGARVLSLFAEEEGRNLYWTNPQLALKAQAARVFASPDWVHTGGDRTWISPEVDTCVGDITNPWGSYKVPYNLDPGHYLVERGGGVVKASASVRAPLHRRKTFCDVEIEKAVRMIPNPLRRESQARDWLGEVHYVGYEQTTSLRLLSTPDPAVQVGIWNIIALPAGGEMLVPALGRITVRTYFGSAGPEHLTVGERSVHLRIDGQVQYKVGLRAASLTGRAGYLRSLGANSWGLVVRNFAVNPSGEYIDVPWDGPEELGYAFEAYNDDGKLGAFGELEYHVPAIGGDTGLTSSVDQSQVWAFSGPERRVRAIAELLLGAGAL